MEEKKVAWNKNTLWSFFGLRKYARNFFGRSNYSVDPKFSLSVAEGFTLIELLITIALIGVLAGGIVVAVNPVGQLQKANDAKRKSDLAQLKRAFELYYNDAGRYPESCGNYQIKDVNGSCKSWGGPWPPYVTVLPKDPKSPSRNYVYSPTSTGQAYRLYAGLERGDDPQICGGGGSCSGSVPAGADTICAGSGGVCNYGVSSSNVTP